MKALLYESKVDSRTALRHRIFAATEHIHKHPDTIVSATQSYCASLKMHSNQGRTLNTYCETGILILVSSIPKYILDCVK